jgi:hypothetical protein
MQYSRASLAVHARSRLQPLEDAGGWDLRHRRQHVHPLSGTAGAWAAHSLIGLTQALLECGSPADKFEQVRIGLLVDALEEMRLDVDAAFTEVENALFRAASWGWQGEVQST